MNDGEIIGKVHSSMYTRLKNQGVVAPYEVLMDIGVLSKEKYEGKRQTVPYINHRLFNPAIKSFQVHKQVIK